MNFAIKYLMLNDYIGNDERQGHMFTKLAPEKNEFMLTGPFRRRGYDWWWHSFTARNAETGEEKPFFIEYFTINPALGGDEPILGQAAESKAKGLRPSYLMVKAGCWGEDARQMHRFFGWNHVKIHGSAPFSVEADDCFCSDEMLKGSVCVTEEDVKSHPEYICEAGTMEWDLKLDKKIAWNVGYGTSRILRAIKAFQMYWHAEGMKTELSGTVIYNGEKYVVEPQNSFGYSDKNWGRGFTSPWVWLSSCDLKSNLTGKELKNSVFDVGGGRPKVYCVALDRKLLGGFCYEGECFEFNFSKLWTLCRTKFDCKETEDEIIWHVAQETRTAAIEYDIRCAKKDMLFVKYEDPDGMKRHNRLWNGGNGSGTVKLYRKVGGKRILVDDMTARHIGCEYGEYGHYDEKGKYVTERP